MPQSSSRKVLLIGWDAADWKVITPLLDAGQMPNLEKLISTGVMGNIATLYPVLSPMLWTSIATGKRAHKHGIHGFSEPDPQLGTVRPITNLNRQTKAIWNILNQNGLRSHVVGWWPSHPAEPINGVMVSNQFQSARDAAIDNWPMRPGTVHPPRLARALEEFRIHPAELDGHALLPFVPRAGEIDQSKDKRLSSLASIIAENASIHAAASALMQLEPWDFMAVYFDGIDHFSHGFMKFHPPRLEWIEEEQFELYRGVVEAGYRFHDMMLGTYLKLAGEDTTFILVSDHGFHPDHLRPKELPNEPAGPAAEHRHFGMFVMQGPGIKRDELVFGATLLDITPTILHLYGLPTGQDMDGRPLLSALQDPADAAYIPSWDAVAGDAGLHTNNEISVDPADAQEAIKSLVDLGYMDAPDADAAKAVEQTVRELRYNLARDLIDSGKHTEALPILAQLWAQFPEESRFGVLSFHSEIALRRTQDAARTLQQIETRKRRYTAEAATELARLNEEWKDRARDSLTQAEWQRVKRLSKRAGTNLHAFAWLRALLAQAEGRLHDALAALTLAEQAESHHLPSLYQKQGEILLQLRRRNEAETRFRKVLALDPVNPAPYLGLCRCHLGRRQWQEALDAASASIGMLFHQPLAHLYCGFALARLERQDEALAAYTRAVQQHPTFPAAHRLLARLQAHRGRMDLARHHRDVARQALRQQRTQATEIARPESIDLHQPASLGALTHISADLGPLPQDAVVIVSGLPRSGTSMMMQMLAAGGVPVLSDQVRGADSDNPRGYFELDAARTLRRDNTWLATAGGKAVKLVAQLLPHLPPDSPYRILFMERPIGEIVASQSAMLARLGREGGRLSQSDLARTYLAQIRQVRATLDQPASPTRVLGVNYASALADPLQTAARINAFLGGGLDEAAMAAAVAPELRRQRLGT